MIRFFLGREIFFRVKKRFLFLLFINYLMIIRLIILFQRKKKFFTIISFVICVIENSKTDLKYENKNLVALKMTVIPL